MSKFHRFGVAALLLVGAQGAAAATYTLDFSGLICNGGMACMNGQEIDQTYGDVAGVVDVTYDRNGAAGRQPAFYWSAPYETLMHVAYGDVGQSLLIFFTAAPGKEVTINGFDIAPYADRNAGTTVRVIDEANATVDFEQDFTTVSTQGVTSFAKPATPGAWTSTIMGIALGPDIYNVGIDNISFTVSEPNGGGVNPIPLPAAAWLLLGGLGALGAAARRRR
jgi:hypothetical protein